MNFYIPIAIIIMTGLFVIIRLFKNYGVNPEQGIIFNYFAASATAFLFDVETNLVHLHLLPGCFSSAWFIGFLFVSVFLLTAHVIHTSGLTIASVVSKMSVIIPVLAGLVLYNEKLNLIKSVGIALGLAAVFLINIQRHPAEIKKFNASVFTLLIIFFLGSGLVDTSIKYAQAKVITPENEKLYFVALFASAFIFGALKLSTDVVRKRTLITIRNIAGGCVLGIANYFSLYFVVQALAFQGSLSAVTYPIMNIGVLVLTTVTGIYLFSEKLEPINYGGIILAILAIVALSV